MLLVCMLGGDDDNEGLWGMGWDLGDAVSITVLWRNSGGRRRTQ